MNHIKPHRLIFADEMEAGISGLFIEPSHAPHSVPALKPLAETLYVVTAISNPVRFHSRYRLYRAFEKHIRDSGAKLITVEAAFGHRPFEVTQPDNPWNVQLRTPDELWYKENLLNIGISRLPADAKYIAVVDADFTFARPDWAQETMQQLQHHEVVQMFSQVHYLNHQHEGVGRTGFRPSFLSQWLSGRQIKIGGAQVANEGVFLDAISEGYGYGDSGMGAPGGAWAFRRSALDALGGLIDYSILGSADYFMAAALIGHAERAIPAGYSPGFRERIMNWQSRSTRHIRQNVGMVHGVALHGWHGRMSERGYCKREEIHKKYQFDPVSDLRRDTQGLWRLEDDHTPRFIRIRDEIRHYFRSRNEDATEE